MSFLRNHFQHVCVVMTLLVVLFLGARFARGIFDEQKKARLQEKAFNQNAAWEADAQVRRAIIISAEKELAKP